MVVIVALVLLLFASPAAAQVVIDAVPVATPLRLDGRLDEEAYSTTPPITTFIQTEPNEGAPSSEPTEAWVFFDDEFLYVAGRMHDSQPGRWVLNEMRRDLPAVSNNESFGVSIDTFHDRRNGFLFEVNALGGFLDAQVTNESFPQNQDWNAVWDS
ncbi:MAG: carbohydrate binding family 9 domain-containing protein, partial [Vicinamibacterales bacterium]